MNPLLDAREQSEFAQAAAGVQRIAGAQLAQARSPQAALALVSHLHRGVDRVFAQAKEMGTPIACKPGCSHCCSARVHASEPEVLQIAATLRTQSPQRLQVVLQRLRTHAAVAATMTVQNHHTPCPFLEDAQCTVYAVRPAVCRKAHALDATPCMRRDPEIAQSLNLIVKAEALMKGTSEAYQAAGLAAGSHELGSAVLQALGDPGALAQWHAGKAGFAQAPQRAAPD